jgi:hypothetical protein
VIVEFMDEDSLSFLKKSRHMPEPSLTALEEKTNIVLGGLRLVVAATTGPRGSIRAYKAVERLRLLACIRQLLRIDLSAIDLSAAEQLSLVFLRGVLTYYREIATSLDRLLQVEDPRQRKRIRKLVGTREAIESVLETLEDKIEDLEIATSPEVCTAIEQLIDEAKSP